MDDAGFLNRDRHFYSEQKAVDLFIAGDSVIQGAGMPGVVETIKSKVPLSVFGVATGSYSPRQKVEALRQFAAPKSPKWLLLEFYSGNDASESIEDNVCEHLALDSRCRFEIPVMATALAQGPYSQLAYFADSQGATITWIRGIRENSITLALLEFGALKLRNTIKGVVAPSRVEPRLGDEAVVQPGYAHFEIRNDVSLNGSREDWTSRSVTTRVSLRALRA